MSNENITNVEATDFTFPQGRKRRRSPEMQTWFLPDNRSSRTSPIADERGPQESSPPQSENILSLAFIADPSKRRKATDESTSRRAVFRFPRLESCETDQPEWFQDALLASAPKAQFHTPLSSPPYSDEPIHCWDETLLERYSNKRSTLEETLFNTGNQSVEDPADPTEAERLFSILEKRFYSDEHLYQEEERHEKEQEEHKKEEKEELAKEEKGKEEFYDAKEYFSEDEDSELSFSVLLEPQHTSSSSLFSEVSFSVPLRRSQRTRKTKRAFCVGCEDCTRPAKRKNSRKENHQALEL